MLVDSAVIVDKGGASLIIAGRPQPPPAEDFAICGITVACICTLCFSIIRWSAFSYSIRAEVFIYLGYAEKKYFVGSIVAGRSAI